MTGVQTCALPIFHDVAWGREIRLADFQVDDVLSLRFERARLHQNGERPFDAQEAYLFGKLHGVLVPVYPG